MSPVTSGRFWVRFISASMSRSTYMLMALAPPAASVPPMTVAAISQSDGMPLSATTMVGTVVTSRSSMIRGLVSATYPPTRERREGSMVVAIGGDRMRAGSGVNNRRSIVGREARCRGRAPVRLGPRARRRGDPAQPPMGRRPPDLAAGRDARRPHRLDLRPPHLAGSPRRPVALGPAPAHRGGGGHHHHAARHARDLAQLPPPRDPGQGGHDARRHLGRAADAGRRRRRHRVGRRGPRPAAVDPRRAHRPLRRVRRPPRPPAERSGRSIASTGAGTRPSRPATCPAASSSRGCRSRWRAEATGPWRWWPGTPRPG